MAELIQVTTIPPMTDAQVERVRQVEALSKSKAKQTVIPVDHFLHAGMYVRTVKIPRGIMITGALIRVQTVLVVAGHAMLHDGDQWVEVKGYTVIPAAAHRKQIFVALTDVNLTMSFPTDAKTVKDAEEQFTSEAHLLQNRGV